MKTRYSTVWILLVCLGVSVASRSLILGAENADLSRRYYEPNRCGPIALYCVCKQYGIKTTIDELAELSGFRGRPTSVAALVNAAQAKGLIAKPYESSLRHLTRTGGPAILDFPIGHLSVFLGWNKGKARIMDPPRPVKTVTQAELKKKWGRHLITFSVPKRPAPSSE